MADCFAEVVLPRRLDRVFDYAVPEALRGRVRRGVRVLVPFGLGPQALTGYVVGLSAQAAVARTKSIIAVLDPEPVLDETLLDLTRWVAETYVAPWGFCVKAALPPGIERAVAVRRLIRLRGTLSAESLKAVRGRRQRALLERLGRASHGSLSRDLLARTIKDLAGVLRALKAKGLVEEETVVASPARRRRQAVPSSHPTPSPSPTPHPLPLPDGAAEPVTPLWAAADPVAVEALRPTIEASRFASYLVHGQRDSRLAVYLKAAAEVRARGRGSLLLFPEVTAIEPVIPYVRAAAGDRLAVIHSALPPSTRRAEWQRVRTGAADIVIGTRSAVFAPLPALGLIVVDEEHDPAYKAEESPRYLTRDVAGRRAESSGAVVLFGATAPSVESYHAARTGSLTPLRLPEAERHAAVAVVDLRAEEKDALITPTLRAAIADRLTRRERTCLLLNRRGYFSVLLCRDCGETLRCPRCSVSLALHQPAALRCHACGRRTEPPQACPSCHGTRLIGLGTGTERLEEELRRAFPDAAILRLDRDVAGRRWAAGPAPGHGKAEPVANHGDPEIILGTHLLLHRLLSRAPGQPPAASLIGILVADVGLHRPDFRAGEQTFHLLMQLKGLLGPEGTLVIQTYHPHHPAVMAAAGVEAAGADAFYEQELRDRRLLGYPPFTRLARLVFIGPVIERLRQAAERVAAALQAPDQSPDQSNAGLIVLGPSPAALHRLRGRYRWQLLVKASPSLDLSARLRQAIVGAERHGVTVSVDVDPVQFL